MTSSLQPVRVGLVGVGNNASAFVQGVRHYAKDPVEAAEGSRDGIRFPRLCGYAVDDIEFTSAFDVDRRKIGLDLGAAVFCAPNCYPQVLEDVSEMGVLVSPGPVLDGVAGALGDVVDVGPDSADTGANGQLSACADIVRESRTEVLVNFLPSGAGEATTFYAKVAAMAGVAFVNCTPSPVANSPELVSLFEERDVPLLGDDLESQFGASLIHRTLLDALQDRGLTIHHSYQVNLGGNTDFRNLACRGEAKAQSKMKALSTSGSRDFIDVIPSGGFLPGLGDRKVCHIAVSGRGWLSMPVEIDVKLEVQDSSNALGVVIDLVRLARGALDRGLSGYVPFSYYFKSPRDEKLRTHDAMREIKTFDQDRA